MPRQRPKKRTADARVPVPWVTPPGAPGVKAAAATGHPRPNRVTPATPRHTSTPGTPAARSTGTAPRQASNVYTRSGLEQKLAQFQLDAMMPKWPFRSCDASLTGARA